MHSLFLVALGLVACSPLVHADPNGGYHKSLFSGSKAVATSSELPDARFYSLWSSFLKNLATVTVTSLVVTTVPAATTTSKEIEPIFTIGPYPTSFTKLGLTETDSVYTTVTKSVSSCSSACPAITAPPVLPEITSSAETSSAVEPSKNGTVATSTQREESTTSSTSSKGRLRPSKTPPPLNGPVNGASTTIAPVMGAVAGAIVGWVVML